MYLYEVGTRSGVLQGVLISEVSLKRGSTVVYKNPTDVICYLIVVCGNSRRTSKLPQVCIFRLKRHNCFSK